MEEMESRMAEALDITEELSVSTPKSEGGLAAPCGSLVLALMTLFMSLKTNSLLSSLMWRMWFKSDLRIKKFDTLVLSLVVNPNCLKLCSRRYRRLLPCLNWSPNFGSSLLMILIRVGIVFLLLYFVLTRSWLAY